MKTKISDALAKLEALLVSITFFITLHLYMSL